MKRRNLIIVACFLVYIVIVILPSLIYHYVYPNVNDDTSTLLITMSNGLHNPASVNYAGSLYLGYPLSFLASILHISLYNVWLWFNLLILIPIGTVLYYIGSKLVDWKTGLLMLVIPTFVSGGILNYQVMGIVFNLIETAILIPLLIYFVVKYILEKKKYQLVISIILSIVASTFHTTGLYVPMIMVVAWGIFIIYKLIKREFKKVIYLKYSLIVAGMVVLCFGAITIISSRTYVYIATTANNIVNNGNAYALRFSTPITQWLITFVAIPVIVIIGVSIYIVVKEKIQFSKQIKLYLYILSCWVAILLMLGFGRLGTAPVRAETDCAIALGLIATLLLGIALNKTKDQAIIFMLTIIIVGGLTIQIHAWFQNNSAVKESDKEAIVYLNTLNYSNYNCSSTIPYWIYDDLSKIKYSADATDLIITRNKPMTPSSDKTNYNYVPHYYSLNSQDILVKSFVNNGIEVDIYEKQN